MDAGSPKRKLIPADGRYRPPKTVESKSVETEILETRPDMSELRSIEQERRDLLLRTELPFWRVLSFWNGTSLEAISKDPLVLITLAIYVAVRVYAHVIGVVPLSAALMENTNVDILGGFLSFFLVLFVNQTNSRFLEMYGFCKAASGRIQDIAGLACANLPSELAERLVGHMNAAQISGYVGLNAIGHGSPYSKTHFFDYYNAQHQLVTEDEMKLCSHLDMDSGGDFMKSMCTWCQIQISQARKDRLIDTYQEQQFQDRILAFRAAMDGMYDYTAQPPHFFYIHFLILLSALYLPLFAVDTGYGAGWGEDTNIEIDILNGLIVLLQCIFVVGLRSLGTNMIDPFGDDLEDLSVILYVESTLKSSQEILHSAFGLSSNAQSVKTVERPQII